MNVLVIDSEGIGALSADATHDTRIFTLALLLSSLFVFNSSVNPPAFSTILHYKSPHPLASALRKHARARARAHSHTHTQGAIDESALSNLSLVVNLTKHIQVPPQTPNPKPQTLSLSPLQTKSGARGEDDGSDFSTCAW